jgi:hypothetical protein
MTGVLMDKQEDIKNKDKPETSIGVTGDQLVTGNDGMFPGFFQVDHNPGTIANILCLSEAESKTDYV